VNRLEAAIQGRGKELLLGAAIHRYNPDFVEIANLLGFDAVWIEMEHGLMSFSEAADLCRVASAMGLLTMLRIPSGSSDVTLKAAECGPDIIDLPMANSPEAVAEFVRTSRYAPMGQRGFYSSSRSVQFSINGGVADWHQRVNDELALVVQIETKQAVEDVEAICSVPGVDGVFLGLGDLSTSLGVPGDIQHPRVQRAIERTLAAAKKCGKRILAPGSPEEAQMWVARGASVFFCCSDTSCMIDSAKETLQMAAKSLRPSHSATDAPVQLRIDNKERCRRTAAFGTDRIAQR
jgi:4-hydroxy-2-oxoheptanedioate aldolase